MTRLLLRYSLLMLGFVALLSTSMKGQNTGTASCDNDTIKPFFERCPQNIVLTTADSCAMAQWPPALAFDNCGIPSVSSSFQSGTCFPVGETVVTYVAVDSAGNSATCSFKVIVNRPTVDSCANDTIKPRFINCPTTSPTFVTLDTCLVITLPVIAAVDNCGTPSVLGSYQPGTCFPLGNTTVTFTATDAAGNKSLCSFDIKVVRPIIDSLPCANDTLRPIFSHCPQHIVLTTLDSCAHAQWEAPVAEDNCSTPSVIGSHQSGMCFPLGSTTVSYVATDSAGNKANCTFNVVVTRPVNTSCTNDTIRPLFSHCPPNLVITTPDTCAVATWDAPSAIDNCSTPSVTGSHQSGMCFPLGETNVTYTATDSVGNKSVCSFIISVIHPTPNPCANDTINPTFVKCPESIALTSLDSCARAQWAAPIVTDNCSTPSVTSTHQSGSCFQPGVTEVIYTATDSVGNKSVCSFTVTVLNPCDNDTIKPSLSACPPNITLTTIDTCARTQWNAPLATDNCGLASLTSSSQNGACFPIGTTTVVYTALDRKGNSTTCSFTVTVVNPCANDTIKPTLSACPQNITLTTSDTCARAQWNAPLATDNCGLASLTSSHQNGACFPIGTTTVVYTASDRKSNKTTCSFTVTVVNPCANDTVKPRFYFCPSNVTVNTQDSCARVTWSGPYATDNCSRPVISGIYTSGTCFPVGTSNIVYTATDAKGNTATCVFKITVNNPCLNDTTKPRFTFCPSNVTVNTQDSCARVYWSGPYVTDNCSTPTLASNYKSGDCIPVGTTTVTYTATDKKGNSSICSFKVTVNNPCFTDTIKPRFYSCPTNITRTISDSCAKVTWNGPYATDNCSTPTITGNFKSGDCFPVGTSAVIFTASDRKGNKTTCSFTVTINNPCFNDTTKPRFTYCPTNMTKTTLDSCGRVSWSGPYASDNCGTPTLTSNYRSGDCFPIGTTQVSYTATDRKGNTSVCSFNITIVNPCANDSIKPRFYYCPTDLTVTTKDSCAKVTWNGPFATDNCSTVTLSGSYKSGDCFPVGMSTVTFTAADRKGNTATCSFKITVSNPCLNDTIKPIIRNCPSSIAKSTADSTTTVTWTAPTATDNCAIANLTASHNSGASFGLGTTVVTYTAKDLAGNTSTCSFSIVIRSSVNPCLNDTIAPVLRNCPADITVKTSTTSAIAQWTKPTATDNCTNPSVTGSAAPGASFPIGTTPVVYTATDAKGNASVCSFNVIVVKDSFVLDTTKCYIIVSRSSKKVVSVLNASTTSAADVVQWSYLNGQHQKFMIAPADSNSVNLTFKHTNMNLDTRWGSLANGSKLMQYTKTTAATQKWQLIPVGGGYFKIVNKGSGRALSVSGGTSATVNGNFLVQQDYAGLTSQQWSIEAVSCSSTSGVNLATNDVLDVTAQPELNRARIEWVDNTGFKNDYYEVEKLNTTSGKFESLKIVNNTTFDNSLTHQTVYDEQPTEGDNFYRVKVVYLDSLEKVSTVQKVSFSHVNAVKVFPNPANDIVDIDLASYNSEIVTIHLYNRFGQPVATQTVQNGKNTVVHLDVAGQPSGQYLIRISAQGKRDVTKQVQIVH